MRPLMAQPLASRMGPRLRWRSLSQAIIMLGPEMAAMRPTRATGIQGPRSMNLPKMPTSTALMEPRATPRAATVPTSVLRGAAAAVAVAALAAAVPGAVTSWPACVPRLAVTPSSLAEARLATCSSTMRRNFL